MGFKYDIVFHVVLELVSDEFRGVLGGFVSVVFFGRICLCPVLANRMWNAYSVIHLIIKLPSGTIDAKLVFC